MDYIKKVEIMKAAIQAEMIISEDQKQSIEKSVEKGIIDGFLRIEQLLEKEKRVVEPYFFFPVERVQEGFGFWNSGGYNLCDNIGRSAVAAGADGERLKIVRCINERNGKHCLTVVYPGCYIAISIASNRMESDNTSVYRICEFHQIADQYQAKCEKVHQMEPMLTRLNEEDEKMLSRLMGVSNRVAITPNLYKLWELL